MLPDAGASVRVSAVPLRIPVSAVLKDTFTLRRGLFHVILLLSRLDKGRVETTEHDLLQGSITRRLIRLAAPLIAGNILQQFYNTFDVFVIGRYAGELEYAAIGTSGTLMNLFLFAVSGMCGGMLVLFARHYGRLTRRRSAGNKPQRCCWGWV